MHIGGVNIFILIEIDKDWTFGIDWGKRCKGIRLGFLAIHFVNVRFMDFWKMVETKGRNRRG